LLILGIGALQVLLERGEAHDWFESREIIGETVVAGVAIVAFLWHEWTTTHPVVNLRILKNRQLFAGTAFGLVLGFGLYASVFALPVFLQTDLGYSAWDTGLVILPGAIAAAITMAVAGRLSGKVDARLMILVGALLFMYAMWLHYHFTLDIGMGDLFWPMIFRGVGLGFIFVPLSQLAVADLKSSELGQGTGLFNLSRQLGGSFGIAVAATLLTRFTEQGREALRTHLEPGASATRVWLDGATARLSSLGGSLSDAHTKALALLDGTLHQQASVVAFEKVFLTMGLAFVITLPLLLLFRTGKTMGGPPAH
jgi:DHA2 family multidrug resistance protein